MAYIKTIKDTELRIDYESNNEDVYPVSTTQALYSQYEDPDTHEMVTRMKDNKPEVLEDRLKDHEDDAVKLHKESEKLTPRVTANSSLFEITGNTNEVTLTGSAQVEVFNPDESKSIPVADMSVKELTLKDGNYTYGPYDTAHAGTGTNPTTWIDSIEVPNKIGSYIGKFDVTYNGVSKYATASITATVKTYYGFIDDATIGQGNNAILEALIANSATSPKLADSYLKSSISNWTITVPPNGTGFKYIYFATPSNISINKVKVGSTNYDFPLYPSVTVTRTYNEGSPDSFTCDFNLYKSTTDPKAYESIALILNPNP